MKLTVAGNKGSFSHQAGMMFVAAENMADADFVFALDSAGVFKAVTTQQADYGIMPIYNPTAGLVKMTLAAMGKHQFEIVSTFDLPVMQCLLTLPHVRQDEIRTVVSHQQALAQCARYLNVQMSDCQLVEYVDTAQAAADLATGKLDEKSAVIAPQLCAQLYGLRLVAENIQDDDRNQTHFIVVKYLTPNPSPAFLPPPNPLLAGVGKADIPLLRSHIDQLDEQIVALVGKRFKLAQQIGQLKKGSQVDVQDPKRETDLFMRMHQLSQAHDVPLEVITHLYDYLMEQSRKVQ